VCSEINLEFCTPGPSTGRLDKQNKVVRNVERFIGHSHKSTARYSNGGQIVVLDEYYLLDNPKKASDVIPIFHAG
jgi:hypothetical protein